MNFIKVLGFFILSVFLRVTQAGELSDAIKSIQNLNRKVDLKSKEIESEWSSQQSQLEALRTKRDQLKESLHQENLSIQSILGQRDHFKPQNLASGRSLKLSSGVWQKFLVQVRDGIPFLVVQRSQWLLEMASKRDFTEADVIKANQWIQSEFRLGRTVEYHEMPIAPITKGLPENIRGAEVLRLGLVKMYIRSEGRYFHYSQVNKQYEEILDIESQRALDLAINQLKEKRVGQYFALPKVLNWRQLVQVDAKSEGKPVQ